MSYFVWALSLFITLAVNAGEITKKLTPISDLKSRLSFMVYIPRFIPSGFKLSKCEIISEEGETDKFSPNYVIEYCNAKNDCYTFESASEFGDGPEGSKQEKGNSKLLGAFQLFFFPPRTEGNDTAKNYILSSWVPEKKNVSRRYHLFGNGLSLTDARKIIESLEAQ